MKEDKMPLKELTTFSDSLKGIKILAITFVIASLMASTFVFIYAIKEIETITKELDKARKEKFVLDPNSGFMLNGSYRMLEAEDRKILYKALVSRFIDLFYDFDGETFQDNLKLGINYSSEEVANIKLQDYLKGSSSYNLGQKLLDEKMVWYAKIDSIEIRTDLNPITGIVFARKKVVKPIGTETYKLYAKFTIRDLDKITSKNEYSCIINSWIILDESLIEE